MRPSIKTLFHQQYPFHYWPTRVPETSQDRRFYFVISFSHCESLIWALIFLNVRHLRLVKVRDVSSIIYTYIHMRKRRGGFINFPGFKSLCYYMLARTMTTTQTDFFFSSKEWKGNPCKGDGAFLLAEGTDSERPTHLPLFFLLADFKSVDSVPAPLDSSLALRYQDLAIENKEH